MSVIDSFGSFLIEESLSIIEFKILILLMETPFWPEPATTPETWSK